MQLGICNTGNDIKLNELIFLQISKESKELKQQWGDAIYN